MSTIMPKNLVSLVFYTKTPLRDNHPINTNQVYCHKMSKNKPKEFISVNPEENFSEIYDRRLLKPNTCPANPSNCSSCFKKEIHPNSGLTRFSKLRFNISAMQIISQYCSFT